MKKFYILLIIAITAASCSETSSSTDCENPDYSNCNTTEPSFGQIILDITFNQENQKVPVIIYKGKIENNNVYFSDTAYTTPYILNVDLNYYYAVKAFYKSGSKTIIAVDGDDVKSKSNTNCDSICWSVQNGDIDLRLKY